jgi:hypothetical protein
LVLLKEHSAWSKVRSSTDDIIVVTCEAAGQVPQETVTPQGFIPDAILIAPQLNLLEVKNRCISLFIYIIQKVNQC